MAKIILASSLSRFTRNKKVFEYDGEILRDILADLSRKNKELGKFIFTGESDLHPFVNIFVDDENVREKKGLDTEMTRSSVIRILPGISGG